MATRNGAARKPAAAGFHEDLWRGEEAKPSSNRSFGLVFTTVFLLLGIWPVFSGNNLRNWALVNASALLIISLVRPSFLAPFNRLWTRFGLLLGWVMSPVVLGFLFFCTVTPVGLLMRLLGKAPLRLRWEPDADTYWIEREPSGPPPDTMLKQF